MTEKVNIIIAAVIRKLKILRNVSKIWCRSLRRRRSKKLSSQDQPGGEVEVIFLSQIKSVLRLMHQAGLIRHV